MRCGRSLLSLCWNRHCHAVQGHNIEQSTSVRLACYTVCSFVGLTAATQFSASEFLKKYETEFFEVVDPRVSLLRLIRKGVITDVMFNIYTSNTDDAREVLYHHLAHHANVDTLKEYLRVAIVADGHPKMQSLGRKMMEELEQGGWSELCAYLCVCACCTVPAFVPHVHPLSALQVSRPTDGDHLPLLTHSSWHSTTCDCKHTQLCFLFFSVSLLYMFIPV